MSTTRPPFLKLVAHNDDAALFGRQAFENLKWSARAMANNLAAVSNGSGSTTELLHQIRDVAAAIEDAEVHAPLERVAAQMAEALGSTGRAESLRRV